MGVTYSVAEMRIAGNRSGADSFGNPPQKKLN